MTHSASIELPFYPQFETEHTGAIRVTWFEPKFSQSHYNVHNKSNGSNACTLIAILMAAKCQYYNVTINDPLATLNVRLIRFLAISMLEGNRLHEELKLRNVLKHLNLNVPEALKFTEDDTCNLVEWKSSIYMERISKSLFNNIKNNYKEWLKLNKYPKENLYVVLIADSRTVLFLIQTKTKTITLFDSHQHTLERGAFIAITNLSQLGNLCCWFANVLRKCYGSDPDLYELSFLHLKNDKE